MMHLGILSLLVVSILISTPLNALVVVSKGIKNQALFGIEFPGDARSYYGKEAAVLSISKQEYITAAYRVVEVNIVTNGPALLRVYHSRSLRPGEMAAALSDAQQASGLPGTSIIRTPMPPQVEALAERGLKIADTVTGDTVIKEYPMATHAHTIEFRVSSRDELLALHDELKKHWLKEPAYYEGGQITDESGATSKEMKPRNLGGTLFRVEE